MRIWSCTGIFFTGWSVSIQGRFAATQHYVSTVSSCQTSGFSASPECDTDMGHCRCFESLARSICRGCRTGSRTTTRATKDPRTKKPRNGGFFRVSEWCRREDSNFRPTHYECVALPTELLRHAGEGAQYSRTRLNGKVPRAGGPGQPSPRIRISTSMLSLRVPSGIVGNSLNRTCSSGISRSSPVSTL